jgi:hypothetical protein
MFKLVLIFYCRVLDFDRFLSELRKLAVARGAVHDFVDEMRVAVHDFVRLLDCVHLLDTILILEFNHSIKGSLAIILVRLTFL